MIDITRDVEPHGSCNPISWAITITKPQKQFFSGTSRTLHAKPNAYKMVHLERYTLANMFPPDSNVLTTIRTVFPDINPDDFLDRPDWRRRMTEAFGKRAFLAARPNNAIKFTDEQVCENCGHAATIRCDKCPPSDPTFYCSMTCQDEDRKKRHSRYCINKRFYAATREIKLERIGIASLSERDEKMKQSLLDAIKKFKFFALPWYWEYLTYVSADRRPVKMLGNFADWPQAALFKPAVVDTLVNLRATTTSAAHKLRVDLLWKSKEYRDKVNKDVAMKDRPYLHQANQGSIVKGIEMDPVDCMVLPPGFYGQWWADKAVILDPWASSDIAVVSGDVETEYTGLVVCYNGALHLKDVTNMVASTESQN